MKYTKEEIQSISNNNTMLCRKLDKLILEYDMNKEIIANKKTSNSYIKEEIKKTRKELVKGTNIIAFNI